MQDSEKKSQAERLAEKLLQMKIDITTEDRAAAVKSFNVVPETISRYLNGKVNDNDTAVSLIAFFNKRIEQREKILS